MKNIVALLAATVMLCGCAGSYFTFDKAREVQIGMTESQVQAIMGKPYLVSTQGANDVWIYSFADGFGHARSVTFTLTDGKVTSIPRIPDSFNGGSSGIATSAPATGQETPASASRR